MKSHETAYVWNLRLTSLLSHYYYYYYLGLGGGVL